VGASALRGASLPEKRVRRVPLSHTEMVKPPPAGDFPTLCFIRDNLKESLAARRLPRRILERNRTGPRMTRDVEPPAPATVLEGIC